MQLQAVVTQDKPYAGVIDGQAFLAKLQKKGMPGATGWCQTRCMTCACATSVACHASSCQ